MDVTTRGNTAYRAGVKNRTLVSSFLDSWIGFSEKWEPPELVVGTPIVTNLPADTEKRTAVVAAFKVRMLLVKLVSTFLSRVTARLVGLR